MAQKLIKKYVIIVLAAASIFVLGGFGGLVFDRILVPKLSTFSVVARSDFFKKLTERVTVINKTEQVVIRENDTVEKVISQPATAVVNIVLLSSENKTLKKEIAPKTGVLLTNDGLMVTYSEKPFGNSDLRYVALLFDNTSHAMTFVGYDSLTNLSFFRLSDSTNTPAISLANSDDARIGKKLITLGNGLQQYQSRLSVNTLGSINHTFNLSGKTVASSEKWEGVFETDLATPENFIGAPVVSYDGEMVGLVGTLTIDNTVHAFLVPSNAVRESFDRVVAGTLTTRPVLGVYYLSLTKALSFERGISQEHGALIYSPSGKTGLSVLSDSPAMKAGLLAGDIIVTVNDNEINLDNPLSKILGNFSKGDTIELLIIRSGQERKVTVNL